MIIKGKDLLKLGFIKDVQEAIIPTEESEYHFYTFYTKQNSCLFISCANDEKVNGGYEVELSDTGIKFRDLKDLKKMMKLIKKACDE